jgi:hypothetical protein
MMMELFIQRESGREIKTIRDRIGGIRDNAIGLDLLPQKKLIRDVDQFSPHSLVLAVFCNNN